MPDSLQPHGLQPTRLLHPWNFLGKSTGVGCHFLLRGIFETQGSNPGLLHCRCILYQPSHKRSPRILEWVGYPFSRGSSRPRDWTRVSCIAGRFFTSWAIRGALSSTQFRSKSQNTDKCLPAWTSVLVGEANNDKENFLTFWVKTKVDYEAVCYYLVERLGKEYRSKNKKLL